MKRPNPIATASVAPKHMAQGFTLRRRLDGPRAPGFWGEDDQVTLVHTRGRTSSDWLNPISVHVTANTKAVLSATENRPGVGVDVGLEGVEAIYHDGWWAPSATGAGMPRWLTGTVHSVTIRTSQRVFAVRAPASVPVSELVAIAAGLPLD